MVISLFLFCPNIFFDYSFFDANMYLAEDRIFCYELVFKGGRIFDLGLCEIDLIEARC